MGRRSEEAFDRLALNPAAWPVGGTIPARAALWHVSQYVVWYVSEVLPVVRQVPLAPVKEESERG